MKKLGISIYPEHSSLEENLQYIELAAKYGFTRLFTCFLSVDRDVEAIKEEFIPIIKRAHELGFRITIDTNPGVFSKLGANPQDISIFSELGIDVIRLDGNFDEESNILITRNPFDIKIEYNGSSETDIESLIRHGANRENILIGHNFYPQRYTGLSQERFDSFNKRWEKLGCKISAFVTSREPKAFGPWPVYNGLPTLEADRYLPIDAQLRHMVACDIIDSIFISNAFASEKELSALANTNLNLKTMKIEECENVTATEKGALYNYDLRGRIDYSEYFIRVAFLRNYYKQDSIPYRKIEKTEFTRGDVLIVNDNLSYYRGEIQVVLNPIENDGQRNYLGKIADSDMRILNIMEKHPELYFKIIK